MDILFVCTANQCRSAMAEAIRGGDAPDAILLPATYDGRDIAGRLSVKLVVAVRDHRRGGFDEHPRQRRAWLVVA